MGNKQGTHQTESKVEEKDTPELREFSDIEAQDVRFQILHGHITKERSSGMFIAKYDEPIPNAPWGHLKTWDHIKEG